VAQATASSEADTSDVTLNGDESGASSQEMFIREIFILL
jgi:hypothetical protein